MSRPASLPPRSHSERIAIACSGLGHIHRGIESWASDMAVGLLRRGAHVTLFGGRAGGLVRGVATLRRGELLCRTLGALVHKIGGWHIGLDSAYDLEQATFAIALLWHLRHDYDIVHVQDPLLARLLEAAHRSGVCRAKVIYANGTNEPLAFARRFAHLQVLTPELARAYRASMLCAAHLHVIPNFVDTTLFVPGSRRSARAALGLPQDAMIILCCAAIRRHHKRIDQLVREFATSGLVDQAAILVVAGAREADTDAIMAEGRALLGDKVHFLLNVPRHKMPQVYQAADIFVLASDHEMFGIVLIEAMACGLPVICNDVEAFRYVVGPAGLYRNLTRPGGIADAMTEMLNPDIRSALAQHARQHVQEKFSMTSVIRQVCHMYHIVSGS
jgi:1,2-diacylglycerol 3-alpha-glucosyltransferase